MSAPSATVPTSRTTAASGGRRGDLDALRGVAMILGVVLHATLAYFPIPWPVQDLHQAPWLAMVYAVIHGFRMQLFFLLSGFFTMLVLRRRGLRGLLAQRALRIALPLVVAMLTIVPLNQAVMSWSIKQEAASVTARNPLAGGILADDVATTRDALATNPDVASRDPVTGVPPLLLAAMGGNAEIVSLLLDAGALTDGTGRDGSTPLHGAAFMGHDDVVQLLLDRGADAGVRNRASRTALDALGSSTDMAVFVARFLGLKTRTADEVAQGRARVRERLVARTPGVVPDHPIEALAARYEAALASPRFRIDIAGRPLHLFGSAVFDHLWFLWYLCWLIAAFALAEAVGLGPTGRYRWWLVPLTCLPQALMWSPFGPDTALGLLPTPHLLLFYGCFFWFGAGTYAAEGTDTPLGRHWKILLPLSLLVLFPAGIATIGNLPATVVLQPAFAWVTAIGLIGLFRRTCSHPSAAARWLADASYWMYLAHLPLVIAIQTLLRDQPWPAGVKFLAVNAIAVVVLLVTYRWCVRYTPIGWLLNGPRKPHPVAS
ncbi:MAG: acyltransferase family protein [Planctomycetota bacterium]